MVHRKMCTLLPYIPIFRGFIIKNGVMCKIYKKRIATSFFMGFYGWEGHMQKGGPR